MATVLLKWKKEEVQHAIHFSQTKGIHPIGINYDDYGQAQSRYPVKKIQDDKPGTGDNNHFADTQCDFGEFHSHCSGATTNDGRC